MADPENPPGAAAHPPRKAPVKKAPAKKAPAKKAPAKKAPAKKAPAKKAVPVDAAARETAAQAKAAVERADNPVAAPAEAAGPTGSYALPVSLGLAAAGLLALVLSRFRRH